jgi:hypothetical protein
VAISQGRLNSAKTVFVGENEISELGYRVWKTRRKTKESLKRFDNSTIPSIPPLPKKIGGIFGGIKYFSDIFLHIK